jgi:hypothetical protein
VKASNSSPTSTEKSHLIGRSCRVRLFVLISGAALQPPGLIAAIAELRSCLLGYYKSLRRVRLRGYKDSRFTRASGTMFRATAPVSGSISALAITYEESA